MRKKIIFLLLIAILVLLASMFFYKKNASPSSNDEKIEKKDEKSNGANPPSKGQKIISVSIEDVKAQDLKQYEKSVGVVYNLNSANLVSEVSGVVKSVKVEIGDYVQKNQILAIIDNAELENTKNGQIAEINKINAQLVEQKKNLQRYKSLYKNGYVSQSEIDSLDTNVKSLSQQLETAKSLLANYNISLEKYKVKSKISGLVQQRDISEGSFVSVGTMMFSVVDNSELIIIGSYPQFLAGILKKDQEVVIELNDGDIIQSKVKEIKPIIDSDTRSLQVIVSLPNNSYDLKSGETVSMGVLTQSKSNVILLKEESVVLRASGKVVYVVNDSLNQVTEVPVKTGVEQGGMVEVISGIAVGDKVVVNGAGFLTDKTNISIIDK